MQPFKGVENYFTDSLLYWEVNKEVKEPLPDDIDSGNEANSESKEDISATFAMEPIVAYLNDHDCNDSTENDGEWVINENIAFDYSLCLDDVCNFIKSISLHMPLPIIRMACMRIEDDDESVFVVPSFKKNQSLIVFGKVYPKTFTFH